MSKGPWHRAPRHYRRWHERWYPRAVRVWVSRDDFALLWSNQFARVYSGALVRFVSGDADGQRREIWNRIHEGPMKRKERSALVGGLIHASPEELTKRWPRLAEFMTAARFEGSDDTREAPTITIWASGGQWKMSIRDRSEQLVMWLSAETLVELLKMAEGFCQDESGPWRVDDFLSERNGKRVKKS